MWTTANAQGQYEVRTEDESGSQIVLFTSPDEALAWAWLVDHS